MSAPFDPYHNWLGIPTEEQPPNHYRLLGVALFEGDPQVIQAAAERQIVCVSGHRLGQWSAVAQRLLNELSAAKISLLQPETKATYDTELRQQLASGRTEFALPAEDSFGLGILPEQLVAPAAKSPPVIPPPMPIALAQRPLTAPPIVDPGQGLDWPATLAAPPLVNPIAAAGEGTRAESRSFQLNGILLVVLVSAAAAIAGAAFLAVVLRQIDQSHELAAASADNATTQGSQPAEVSAEAADNEPASGDAENRAPIAPRRKPPADTRPEFDAAGFETAEFEPPTDDNLAAMPGEGAMPGDNGRDAKPAALDLPLLYREDGVILHVAISPDGHEAVSIAQLRRAPLPNSVRFWSMEDGTQVSRELKLPFDATIARYSSSGRELLLGTSSGKATVISLETGETLAIGRGQGPVSAAIATGNDAFLFVRPNQLVIEGWDRGHNVLRVACESLKVWPAWLALSADNTALLTASPARKMPNAKLPEPRAPDKKPTDKNAAAGASRVAGAPTLQLWNILATASPDAANQRVYRATLTLDLSNQLAGLSSAALAADGRKILFAGSDGEIHVWDVQTSVELRKLSGHSGIVTSMSLSSDGSRLISGSDDRTVRAWAVAEGIELMRYDGHAGSVRSVAIAPDGRMAISGADDGQLRIWRLPVARSAVAANPGGKIAGGNKPAAGPPKPVAIFEPAVAVAPVAKPVAAEVPALAQPPVGSALQRAMADVKKLFRLEFAAAKDPESRVELAAMLLGEAGSYPLPYRFAMLDEARNLAISSGNLGVAQNAIRLLAEQFDIDTAQATAEMLEQLSHQPLTTEARQALAAASLMAAEELLASEKYATARKLLAIAVGSVRKTSDARLSVQIADRTAAAAELQKLFDRFSAGEKTLAGQSDDAAAHLAVGRYLCFVRQDWAAGFPHLAAGDNAGLQEVARLELAGSPRPADMVKLADAWWKLAQVAKGKERADCFARSRHWYQTALPELAGLTETRVTQRLAELEAQDLARNRNR